jgi:hypothetical protein
MFTVIFQGDTPRASFAVMSAGRSKSAEDTILLEKRI